MIIINLTRFYAEISYKTDKKFNRNAHELNNCLLDKVLNLHIFPLLSIKCTEPFFGPLYKSYINLTSILAHLLHKFKV